MASGVHYNFLPSNMIFECLMFLFFLASFLGGLNKKYLVFFFLSAMYIFYGLSSFLIVENHGRLSDFLLIYKPFVYVCMLSIFYGKNIFTKKYSNRLYTFVIFSFSFKYLMSIFIFDISRPGVFTENNFELMLVGFLFLATYDVDREFESRNYLLLVLVSCLSFSRSAILFTLVIFLFLNFKGCLRNKLISYMCLVFLVSIVLIVFLSRLGDSGIESVDRYIFLLSFIREMSNGSLYVWLFGNPPMTNVSFETASALEYYYLVFSDHEKLIAFSAVFNSFILRAIFDHGVIGLSFIVYFSYSIVIGSTFSRGIALSVCSIMLINGMSVSSFQSVYFLLGVFFLISRKNLSKKEKFSHA
ncbi:hypothetical protein [Marinomonas sp. BSi20584]|uniref:hypothetical protein n=1 Tax=Marinomonas sp. BSi20584 TaxID=1594462 RepID=UPI0012FD65A2|nr:hypothetical protein [Marinomonas sp. BSi20584]